MNKSAIRHIQAEATDGIRVLAREFEEQSDRITQALAKAAVYEDDMDDWPDAARFTVLDMVKILGGVDDE